MGARHWRRRSATVLTSTILVVGVGTVACGGSTRPATRRVAQPPSPEQASTLFETGLAQYQRREFAAAAASLEESIVLDPTRAHAYYYAGLAYYEIDRTDRMIDRFETFVRLAPDAPERPKVESILQTVR